MAVFEVKIDRRVVSWDRVTRFVEAVNLAHAEILADQLAEQINKAVPDDCASTGQIDTSADFEIYEVDPSTEDEAALLGQDVLTAADVARQGAKGLADA